MRTARITSKFLPNGRGDGSREPHRAVVYLAVPQGYHVVGIAHAQPPRGARAGPREVVDGAEHVASLEVEQRLRGDGRVVVDRHARVVAAAVHVPEQPAGEIAHQVRLERPGRVGVADGEREVRYAAQHHALVGHRLGQLDRLAVYAELRAAEREQLEAGRGHHDVGRQ